MKMSNEQASLLRDSQLRTLWMARIDYSPQSGVNPHVHDDFYQLLTVLGGRGEVQIDGEHYPVGEGYVYLFPRGTRHGFRFTAETVTLDVKFKVEDEQLAQLFSSTGLAGPCDPEDLADLKRWFALSLKNIKQPHPLLPYRIDSGFKGTLLSMVQKTIADESLALSRSRFRLYDDFPIAEYIRRHIAEKITLEDIAKHFGFHPHYLIKLFHDRTGMSPMQYLQELRLEKAKEYLEMTDLTVAEISERLGWTNSYFSRLFHQREGVSPTEYRKNAVTAVGKDIALEAAFRNEWQIVSQMS